jgi:phosphoglycolate phosphatase-like HAD superfamily hydrolase
MIEDLKKIKQKVEKSKVLIFDFDGVIADSVEVKTEAFAIIYKPYGEAVVEKVIDHHNNNGGMSRFEKFQFYHENFLNQEIDQKVINQLSEQFSKLVFNRVVSSDEIHSVSKFLEKYGGAERICVVNSATPLFEMRKIINARGMSHIFSSVLGSPASKADNIALILNQYNCSKEDVIFFGDSETDLKAAIISGVDFIGIGDKIKRYIRIMDSNFYSMKNFQQISKL